MGIRQASGRKQSRSRSGCTERHLTMRHYSSRFSIWA